MKHLNLYALFLSLISVGVANAAQVFSQTPLDGGVSFGATLNDQISDDFVLSSSTSITSIRWWGGEGLPTTPVADTFSIRFFSDTGSGLPKINPFLTLTVINPVRSASGLSAFPGQPIFEYESALPQEVPLLGGETYYLSIHSQSTINWGWGASTPTGDRWIRSSDGDNWVPRLNPSADLAFELSEIPIPPAFVSSASAGDSPQQIMSLSSGNDSWSYDGEVRRDSGKGGYCSKGFCAHGVGDLSHEGSWDYVGSFVDGVIHGNGTYNGDFYKYVGGFDNGKFHGYGIYVGCGGRLEGKFTHGRFPGKAERWYYAC